MVFIIEVVGYTKTGTGGSNALPKTMLSSVMRGRDRYVRAYYSDDIEKAKENFRKEAKSYGFTDIKFSRPIRIMQSDIRWSG